MNQVVALLPGSVEWNTKNVLGLILGHQVVQWRHIVTEWRLVTLLSDVVDVELWMGRVSDDELGVQ